MKVNLLNERIRFLKATTSVDEIGNHVNEWKEVYSCYATISNESPQEVSDHGVTYDDSKIDFIILYTSEIKDLSSLQYRIAFKDRMYNILGIDHMNYQKKSIKLHCQKVER